MLQERGYSIVEMPLPRPHLHLHTLITALDYTGIAIGAIGGALHARNHKRYQYDIVGALALALVSALGGGIARDVLLNQGPPLALTNLGYLYTALLAALATLLLGPRLFSRLEALMLVIDAIAISLFAVAGTTRAQSFGIDTLPAVMLGITTAVGGGSLRDVLSGTTPRVFERGTFYAIAALFAATSYLVLDHIGVPDTTSVVAAVVLGFTLRMASLRFNWHTDALRISRR
jgi:uncharacterized membrane protein YeiH